VADVILIHPIADPDATGAPRVPLGVLSVAGPLLEDGYEVQVIDQQVDPRWRSSVTQAVSGSPICVGISAMTGNQIRFGLEAAALVRESTSCPIVWGGVHPSLLPAQTVVHPLVDAVVVGEGDETFLDVVRAYGNGRSLAGVEGTWFKVGGEPHENPVRRFAEMDSLPPIPYHLVDVERYITADEVSPRSLELPTSRGCPHGCAFCYNLTFARRRWRTMSPPVILERLTEVVRRYHLKGVNFREDNFFTDRRRVEAVCRGIIDRGLEVGWQADCRCDYFARYDDGFLQLLLDSGLKALTFGAESGSAGTLKNIDKDITVEDILTAARKATKFGIITNFHFMTGFPGETSEELIATYRLIHELLRGDPRRNVYGPALYTPYPGTPLYQRSLELGFEAPRDLSEWANFHWGELNLPWLDGRTARLEESSAFLVEHASPGLHRFYRPWFALRFAALVRSGRLGPLPERRLLGLAKRLRRWWRGTRATV